MMVMTYTPPVPASGVPESRAVPLPLSAKLSPAGRLRVSVRAGSGKPLVRTVKPNGDPTVAVALAGSSPPVTR